MIFGMKVRFGATTRRKIVAPTISDARQKLIEILTLEGFEDIEIAHNIYSKTPEPVPPVVYHYGVWENFDE